MRPLDVQPVGQELAIKWDDGSESYLTLEKLRQACPCAGCKGEVDIMGQLHKGPEQKLSLASTQLLALNPIGSYAIQPVWGDGHESGIYSFEYLRHLAGAT